MLLFIIRHGDNMGDCLTELGQKQAEALSKRLAVYGLDKVYSSPLNRTCQTAQHTAKLLNKDIVKLDYFSEDNGLKYFAPPNDNGELQWIEDRKDIVKKFLSEEVFSLGYKWYNHPDFSKYDFKAGVEFFESNYDKFLLSLGYEHNKETHTYKVVKKNTERVAVFTHRNAGGMFVSCALDIPYPIYLAHSDMSNTGMTVINFGEGEEGAEIIPKLLQFSNDSHLYKEGISTKYCNKILI